MAPQELEKRLKTLEDSVRTVQDIEEIKNLQKIYGYYLEHWQWEEIVELFSDSPDTSVEAGTGVFLGKESVKRFYSHGREKVPPEYLHLMPQVNDVVHIDADGKTAKGRWYGFGALATLIDGETRALWHSGIYENEYVKEGGKWKFKILHWSLIFHCPYEDGWVKTPVPVSREDHKPDQPTTTYKPYPSGYIFPYHFKNPVTGK